MSQLSENQNKDKQPKSVEWRIFALLVIVSVHYWFFHTSFLWTLRNYEYTNKMIWIEEPRQFYPDLILYKNSIQESHHPNGRFREWIVQNPITKEILVQDQFSKIKLSNPDFLNNQYEFDYLLKDPIFYISNDYSISQQKSQMRWIIKGTLINEAEQTSTRIYFDHQHPNDFAMKTKAKNKKNLYVFMVVVLFVGSLMVSLSYLQSTIVGLKQEKYSDFVVAIITIIGLVYFLFYKMIWLWLSIEF